MVIFISRSGQSIDIEDNSENLEPPIEPLKFTRKSAAIKKTFLNALNNIQRAPTPRVNNPNADQSDDDNFRQADKEVNLAEVADEAEMSFHPR